MTLLQLIILGIVQGITEFLPISSSAHLILVPKFMHAADQGLLVDVGAHAGTLLAVLIFFWRDDRHFAKGLHGARECQHPRRKDTIVVTYKDVHIRKRNFSVRPSVRRFHWRISGRCGSLR